MKTNKRTKPATRRESVREYVEKRIETLDEERERHHANGKYFSATECVRARNELVAVLRRLPGGKR